MSTLPEKILSILKQAGKPLTTHDIWFKLYSPKTCRPEPEVVQVCLCKMVAEGKIKYNTKAGQWNHINV